ncbi:MAG: hypothetical protein AAF903_12970 [Pseudomonadota bacterium]
MTLQSLDIAERLSEHGLSREQSEAVAREIVQASTAAGEPLVTLEKFDASMEIMQKVQITESTRLNDKIEKVELKLEASIEAVRNQTLIAIFVIVGFFFALDRFLT